MKEKHVYKKNLNNEDTVHAVYHCERKVST